MAFNPTNEQRMAIEARGGSLLLSAAAGSGKTAVLTQRAVSRMLDTGDNHIDADRLMIVTFTRAAASEMKERMMQKLTEHILSNPDDENAKRQRVLIDRAPIGTIHSLCSELLKQNFQLVGLPASFRIGDDNELYGIRKEAVSSVLERYYAEGSSEFHELSEFFSTGKSDLPLEETILSLIDFARAHPFYHNWLKSKLKLYTSSFSIAGNPFIETIRREAMDMMYGYMDKLTEIAGEINQNNEEAPYLKSIDRDFATFAKITHELLFKKWDNAISEAESYEPVTWRKSKKDDPVLAEERKAVREKAKEFIKVTLKKKYLCSSEAEFFEDLKFLAPIYGILFDIALEIDQHIQNEKIERGIVDFTDLEQMTCSLLYNESGEKSDIAKMLSGRYAEVMVDEFQDVNEVQYSILTALSRDDNLFCVGDVKQSIYRFRMAEPKLFLNREENSFEYNGKDFPAVIRLNGNFRTAPAVTDIINGIFTALMKKDFAEIEYDEKHALVPLGKFSDGSYQGVELCLIENSRSCDADIAASESAWIADEISRILREEKITEDGKLRPAEPRDIAILLRSPRKRGAKYKQELLERGIDASVDLDSGFITSPEIVAVLNALTAISNPMRDVELLGTMSSPLYGFTDDEIAAVRIHTPGGRLWTAVLAAGEENEHCAKFVGEIMRFRSLSSHLPPHALIGELLRSTGYDVICRSMKNGEQREANLRLLMQYAQDESAGVPTLSGFLKRMERIKSRQKDLAPANIGGGANAVSITSIHRSKGLEWPIVFVGELSKEFGIFQNDAKDDMVMHSDLGFASVRKNRLDRKKFETVPSAAVKIAKKRESLAEELRILYVAMTRAKEKLYLTGEVENAYARFKSGDLAVKGRTDVSALDYLRSRCYLGWIIAALSVKYDLPLMVNLPAGENALSVRVVCGHEDIQSDTACEENADISSVDEQLVSELTERIAWRYTHEEAVKLPANMAVSELSHAEIQRFFTSRPLFMEEGGLKGAARGTAVHTFFQHCDYTAAKCDPAAEVQRLCEAGVITPEQAKAISLKEVEKFFESSIADRIFSADRVLREFRFMAPASCSSLSAQYSDGEEATMLQGAADCIIIEGDSATLIDYKTDRGVTAEELCERYRTQVLLYRDMLSTVLDVPVKKCALYSFALGHEIWVDFL